MFYVKTHFALYVMFFDYLEICYTTVGNNLGGRKYDKQIFIRYLH